MNEHEDTATGSPTAQLDDRIAHTYDWTETDPVTAIVETLAVAANRDPVTTAPLYDTVDPDSLNALFSPRGASPASDLRASFRVQDFEVTVRASGEVSVRPVDGKSFPD